MPILIARMGCGCHRETRISGLRNLAVRFPDRFLLWDGGKMEMTTDPDVNADVRRQYRYGWRTPL